MRGETHAAEVVRGIGERLLTQLAEILSNAIADHVRNLQTDRETRKTRPSKASRVKILQMVWCIVWNGEQRDPLFAADQGESARIQSLGDGLREAPDTLHESSDIRVRNSKITSRCFQIFSLHLSTDSWMQEWHE